MQIDPRERLARQFAAVRPAGRSEDDAMATTISRLLEVAPRERTGRWLVRALQSAIELEMFTIPPYLCARWSIKDPHPRDHVYSNLGRIAAEEMKHLGLACNLMTAFGGVPRLNRPPAVPRYPGPLPGGVHPGLRVALRPLSKDLIGTVFMQIEFPSPEAVTTYGANKYPTIGSFYEAIASAIADPSISIVGGPQLEGGEGAELIKVTTRDKALEAVETIRAEGEGAHGSPFVSEGALAHYYRFAEMFWQREIVPCGDGGWGFCGEPIDFPAEIYPMAPVPRGGYPGVPAARAFNRLYTQVLDTLQAAWSAPAGGQQRLDEAIAIMTRVGPDSMASLARTLMQMPRPDGAGNYGPDFRYLKGCLPF
jgi:hypothetical protein